MPKKRNTGPERGDTFVFDGKRYELVAQTGNEGDWHARRIAPYSKGEQPQAGLITVKAHVIKSRPFLSRSWNMKGDRPWKLGRK